MGEGPKWLIEDFEKDNSFHKLAEETKRQGYETEVIKYIPFESGSYNQFGNTECVVCQTSLNLANQLMNEKEWIPGHWLNLAAYECTAYYPVFGKYLLNDEYIMLPRGDVKRMMTLIPDYFECRQSEHGKSLFMRPSSGFKSFTGKVFDFGNQQYFDSGWRCVDEFTEPNDMIIISPPQNIEKEWRFVVAEGEVITGSLYKQSVGHLLDSKYLHLSTNDDFWARNYAQEIVTKTGYSPDPVWTIDMVKTKEGTLHVLEIGCFSCAGLYACDLEIIVKRVSEIAQEEWNEYQNV